MSRFAVAVKPTQGGERFTVTVSSDSNISDFKEEVRKAKEVPVAEQRIIYKGQVLKDERTVGSYGTVFNLDFPSLSRGHRSLNTYVPVHSGIEKDHVVHMVRSRPQGQASGWVPGTSPEYILHHLLVMVSVPLATMCHLQ